ncbi:hypothetical protein ILUMI_04123 [Ignelater luminosus]|uniref:Pacifastin domain-containing protein n=1 Tax=Ignelater luminosus TaxID=2038154 RepID=A0A8K0GJB3_IGNLU|nr:hypothetical protein ILUMI_04123 [Ignelater luminosus]
MNGVFVLIFSCFFTYIHSTESRCDPDNFTCIPRQTYKLNRCQTCRCSESGESFGMCTKIACTYPPDNNPKNCAVGSCWREKCNTCCCYRNIGTVCTARDC